MIFLIVGSTGSGKTSLGVAFGIREMDNGEEQVELAQQSNLAFPDYSKVKIPDDHLVYSDIYICGSEDSNTPHVSHFASGYRFGLSNPDFETDYYPYGSTIIFDETRKYFNARKSMLDYEHGGVHERTFEAFELSRHNGLNIFLICQLTTHIDKNIRELAHVIIEPYEIRQEKVGNKLKKIVTIWKYRKFDSLSEYDKFKNGDKSAVFEDSEYTFNGDIFECYDTEFFKFKFMKGLKKYSNTRLTACDGSKKSVERLFELYSNMRVVKTEKKVKKDEIQGLKRVNYLYL